MEKAFAEWQGRFESARMFDTLENGQFDWGAFHTLGIELCRRLKAEIGDAARVIYGKPFEDPGHRLEERREVLAGGSIKLLRSSEEKYGRR